MTVFPYLDCSSNYLPWASQIPQCNGLRPFYGVPTTTSPFIDLSHNCARDPEKKPRERQCRAKDLARTANLQSFRMEKQEMASLSTSFFRRWPSHISAEDCQYVWAVVDIDFFVRFVSRAEIVAFFVGEGSQTRPQNAAVHSSFDTEKKIAALPKIVVLIFFLFNQGSQCSKNAGVDVSTVINRRKAVSGQIQRELCLSQEIVERSELTSQGCTCHFWSHPMLPLPSTSTSPIQTQSAFEERDRETL